MKTLDHDVEEMPAEAEGAPEVPPAPGSEGVPEVPEGTPEGDVIIDDQLMPYDELTVKFRELLSQNLNFLQYEVRDEARMQQLHVFVDHLMKVKNPMMYLLPDVKRQMDKTLKKADGLCASCFWRYGCRKCDEQKCLRWGLRKTIEAGGLNRMLKNTQKS